VTWNASQSPNFAFNLSVLFTEFILYSMSKGTTQKLTVHDTPLHNGVAEHCSRTIVEHIRALLHVSGLKVTELHSNQGYGWENPKKA
jgi:hypothetical protein